VHTNGLNFTESSTLVFDSFNSQFDWNSGGANFQTRVFFTVPQVTSMTLSGSISITPRGSSEEFPLLPGPGGSFLNAPSGAWMDPPLAQGYTFTITSAALFKEIEAFPASVPGEFYVVTEGTTYGPYFALDSVDFVALRGHGVSSFVVKGIKPFVDATSPVAFPIKLSFTAPTANFTMIPISAPEITIEPQPSGDLKFLFTGVLQSSLDLVNWSDLSPSPTSPYVIQKADIVGARFFRTREP